MGAYNQAVAPGITRPLHTAERVLRTDTMCARVLDVACGC